MTQRHRLIAARLSYVAIILIAGFLDLNFSPNLQAVAEHLRRALFRTLTWHDAIDGLRNMALFGGFGGLWIATSNPGTRNELRTVTWVGFALSLLIEVVQLFSPTRWSSITDVISNTLGTIVGALLMALVIRRIRDADRSRLNFGAPAFVLGGPYIIAVLCEAITPLFRSDPLRGADGGPLSRLRTALAFAHPLSIRHVSAIDFVLFAPAGFIAVAMLVEHGWSVRRAWPLVGGLGAAIAFGAEMGHGILGSSVRWEAATVTALSVLVGAWIAGKQLRRVAQLMATREGAHRVIAGYAALLVVWTWRPFIPALHRVGIMGQLTLQRFIPLASLSEREDVFSALHVAQVFFLYVPLGALLAIWPPRSKGWLADLWPAIWLAVVLELGHVLLAGRFFDVTNAVLAFAGAALAWLVVRQCGYGPIELS